MLSQIISSVAVNNIVSQALKSALSFLPSLSILSYLGLNLQSKTLMNEDLEDKNNEPPAAINPLQDIIKNLQSNNQEIIESTIDKLKDYAQETPLETFKSKVFESLFIKNLPPKDIKNFDLALEDLQGYLQNNQWEIFRVKALELLPQDLNNKEFFSQEFYKKIEAVKDSSNEKQVENVKKITKYYEDGFNNPAFIVGIVGVGVLCIVLSTFLYCEEYCRGNQARVHAELQRQDDDFNNSFRSSNSSFRNASFGHMSPSIARLIHQDSGSLTPDSPPPQSQLENSNPNSPPSSSLPQPGTHIQLSHQGSDSSIALSIRSEGSQRSMLRSGNWFS